MVVACYGGLAGPIACLDRTRARDDIVVVARVVGAMAVCGVSSATIALVDHITAI